MEKAFAANDLTSREQEILKLLLEGISAKEIAYKINISVKTIDTHKTNIYRKLDVHSYKELLNKFSIVNDSQHLLNETRITEQIEKINKKIKLLIPAILILAVISVFFIWFLFIKPNPSLTRREVPQTPVFIDHTFDTVYLKANRFNFPDKGFHGQSYHSYDEILLRDFYNGTLDDLIPKVYEWHTVKISGTTETELKYVKIDLHLKPYGNGNWILVGCTDSDYINIDPGDFSETIKFYKLYNNLSDLPAGEVVFSITSGLYFSHSDKNQFSFDTGLRIPDNVPEMTNMTAIRNLKIEPVIK